MELLNNINDSNFITQDESQMHIVQKYEFKNIDKKLEAQIAPAMEESGIYTPKEENDSKESKILQEKFDELLVQNQQIQESLSLLQTQLQEEQGKQAGFAEELKKASYEQGYLQAKQDLQEEMQKALESEREKLVYAISNLDEKIQAFQEEGEKIKEELSVIALDLAKEVIVKEVEEESAKIALAIANELLTPLLLDADVTLKVNPLDLPYLQEKFASNDRIHLKPDPLVAKGGVLISSSHSNFDGTILSRYRNLKRSILDEKGL